MASSHRANQFPRLPGDVLRMSQMTSVVISHAISGWRFTIYDLNGQSCEHLCQIPDTGAELLCALRPGRIVAQQLAVFFERRAAAGGVDDNRVEVERPEHGNVAPSAGAGA